MLSQVILLAVELGAKQSPRYTPKSLRKNLGERNGVICECEKSITFYHLRRSSSGHFGSGDSSAQIAIGQTDVAAVAGI